MGRKVQKQRLSQEVPAEPNYGNNTEISWSMTMKLTVVAIALIIVAILLHFAWPYLGWWGPIIADVLAGTVVVGIPSVAIGLGWRFFKDDKRKDYDARIHSADERGNYPQYHNQDGTFTGPKPGNQSPWPAALQHLTYSPREIATRGGRVESIEEVKPPELPPPPVPTGRELLLDGSVVKELTQGNIILGQRENGVLATLPIKRCFSSLISGIPSVGKSTTVFWIAGQLVIVGARLWVVDPHLHYRGEDGERGLGAELDALGDSFVFEVCDDDPSQVTYRVRFMFQELMRREKSGDVIKASDTIIGIIDEFNSVAAGFDQKKSIVQYKGQGLNLAQTISLIEREGRKFGLHFMLIGHRWADRDIGGDSAVRTNATTYLCHKMNDMGQADLLLGKGFGKKILELRVGEYWITGSSWREEHQTKLVTPMISAVDLPLIQTIKKRGVIVGNQANVIEAADMPKPMSRPMSTTVSEVMSAMPPLPTRGHTSGYNTDALVKPVDTTLAEVDIPADLQQKMHLVLDLDAKPGGTSQNEIIKQVWGVDPQARSGRAAAEELRQIRAHIAAQLRKRR